MPTVKTVGTPGAANEAIGGVPEIHYFDFYSKGRGQVNRLMFEDAGIAYKDIRYTSEEYPNARKEHLLDLNPLGTLPIIELNGRILTQSYAILRHFARQLGAYEGTTEEEIYWADAICDAVVDWRTRFVDSYVNANHETTYPEHCKNTRPSFLKGLDQQLKSHAASASGPYILGQKVSYADLVLYQICHDEGLTQNGCAGLKEYQTLAELSEAVESRPNIKSFLASDRYLG